MVNLEPYKFQKKTNIDEHNDIVGKVNEIVGVVNNADLDNIGTDMSELKSEVSALDTKVSGYDTRITANTNDITEVKGDVSSLETNVSSLGTRVTATENNIDSMEDDINAMVGDVLNIQNSLKGAGKASTLSTTEHIEADKLGISIDSMDGQSNKVAYIPVATGTTIGLMSASDKTKLDSLSPTPTYELPIASTTELGGVKVGSGLAITAEGVLSTTGGGGGTGADLPLHTVGANDENPLVQVDPVIQSGNIILRTIYKDYKNDGTATQKQDDSTIFPTATTDSVGLMASADKTKLDGMPEASTIATKTEVQAVQTALTEFEGELISDPSALVGLASSAHAGLMSTADKTKLDGITISQYAKKTDPDQSIVADTFTAMGTEGDTVYMNGNGINFYKASEAETDTIKASGGRAYVGDAELAKVSALANYATNDDLSGVENQITGLKLAESGTNGIALNGESVDAVRSVSGSVSGSNLVVNVNGVASGNIALPASDGFSFTKIEDLNGLKSALQMEKIICIELRSTYRNAYTTILVFPYDNNLLDDVVKNCIGVMIEGTTLKYVSRINYEPATNSLYLSDQTGAVLLNYEDIDRFNGFYIN